MEIKFKIRCTNKRQLGRYQEEKMIAMIQSEWDWIMYLPCQEDAITTNDNDIAN